MRPSTLAGALVVGATLWTLDASAAGVADANLRPEDRAAVAITGSATGSPPGTMAAIPAITAGIRLGERFVLTVDAAASFTEYRFPAQDSGAIARIANPIVGGRFQILDAPQLSLRAGVAIGAPLLTVPGGITSNVAAEFADGVANAATGQGMYWIWARNAVPVLALVRAETLALRPLGLRLDVQPGLLVSINRNPSYLALLVMGEAFVAVGHFSPGLRWTTLATSRPLDMHDFAQSTLTAFVRWDPGPFLVWAEAVVGLDGPQGIGAASATWWGASLGGGVRFGG